MRLASLLASLVLCAPLAFAGEAVVHEASSALERPDGASASELHGGCSVRDGSDFQRFTVAVEGAGADATFHVWLGDGHETLHDLGAMDEHENVRILERTTREGGELPFGVESVRDLAERRVEVRNGEGDVVLEGHVPGIADGTDGGGDGTDGGGDTSHEPYVAKAYFHRTDAAGERESRGVLAATLRDDGSSLVMEFGRLVPEAGYVVHVGSGDHFEAFAEFTTNGEGGARVAADTAEGDELPFGASDVSELAGLRVEVRDEDGHVILYAEIPSVAHEEDVEAVHHDERHEDAATGTDVRIVVDVRPDTGQESILIVVRDVPRHVDGGDDAHEGDDAAKSAARRGARNRRRTVVLHLEDGTGGEASVAEVRLRGRAAKIRLGGRRAARSGRELPLGVSSLRALSGRGWSLTVRGVRIASGNLPQF